MILYALVTVSYRARNAIWETSFRYKTRWYLLNQKRNPWFQFCACKFVASVTVMLKTGRLHWPFNIVTFYSCIRGILSKIVITRGLSSIRKHHNSVYCLNTWYMHPLSMFSSHHQELMLIFWWRSISDILKQMITILITAWSLNTTFVLYNIYQAEECTEYSSNNSYCCQHVHDYEQFYPDYDGD